MSKLKKSRGLKISDKLHIAVVAPPYIPIPPPGYGGTELVIHNLVEGLKEIGHKVSLFAGSRSKTSADNFYEYIDESIFKLSLSSSLDVKVITKELGAKYAYCRSALEGADIIHDHTLSANVTKLPSVHTLHGPGTEATVDKCVELSRNPLNNFVSISNRQKEIYCTRSKKINFISTVHNSIDIRKLKMQKEKENFLLFVGRINWEKGPDIAIRTAAQANLPLVMVAKMSEQFEKDFFTQEIQPIIDKYSKNLRMKLYEEPRQEFKFKLYRQAKCTLFTSQWEEPFGLVMIESMACGTPVIALKRGAAPEVILDGKTGFIVEREEDFLQALKKIDQINPED
ncbi:MAG: glycosyltransferase, partial [Elusimicrobiota bacterium]